MSMSMIMYVDAIKRKFITQYKFKENPTMPGCPMNVPDGVYPMKIDGKTDYVVIKNDTISCCNFKKPKGRKS